MCSTRDDILGVSNEEIVWYFKCVAIAGVGTSFYVFPKYPSTFITSVTMIFSPSFRYGFSVFFMYDVILSTMGASHTGTSSNIGIPLVSSVSAGLAVGLVGGKANNDD